MQYVASTVRFHASLYLNKVAKMTLFISKLLYQIKYIVCHEHNQCFLRIGGWTGFELYTEAYEEPVNLYCVFSRKT